MPLHLLLPPLVVSRVFIARVVCSEEDKETIEEAIKSTLDWLEENGKTATKDEFAEKQKEVSLLSCPFLSRPLFCRCGSFLFTAAYLLTL